MGDSCGLPAVTPTADPAPAPTAAAQPAPAPKAAPTPEPTARPTTTMLDAAFDAGFNAALLSFGPTRLDGERFALAVEDRGFRRALWINNGRVA